MHQLKKNKKQKTLYNALFFLLCTLMTLKIKACFTYCASNCRHLAPGRQSAICAEHQRHPVRVQAAEQADGAADEARRPGGGAAVRDPGCPGRRENRYRLLVFWGGRWAESGFINLSVLPLSFRRHYKRAHGVPPARHDLLQPPAVRDGGELLPHEPVLLSSRPAAARRGSLLHQALLPAGQLHSAQAEGRRADSQPRHNCTVNTAGRTRHEGFRKKILSF